MLRMGPCCLVPFFCCSAFPLFFTASMVRLDPTSAGAWEPARAAACDWWQRRPSLMRNAQFDHNLTVSMRTWPCSRPFAPDIVAFFLVCWPLPDHPLTPV